MSELAYEVIKARAADEEDGGKPEKGNNANKTGKAASKPRPAMAARK